MVTDAANVTDTADIMATDTGMGSVRTDTLMDMANVTDADTEEDTATGVAAATEAATEKKTH